MNRKWISYNVPWRWSIWRYSGKNCLCVLSYRWQSVCYLHYWVGMVWIPLKHWTSRPYLPRDGYFRSRGPYCIFWWELHHISFWVLENQTRRHCRFTVFNLFLTFPGPFSFSNLRCIYWHLYGLWFCGFWFLCAVFCFIAFPSHPGISCCHICCGSPLPDTWIYILLFSIKFFLLLSDIMCLFAMEQKKRGGKKSKRKTDITVVNDSRCSSNIGYIRTFLAKCMFCATVPRVTCSVSDLFCIQKTKNCDQCALCRVEKSTRSKICSGCLSANSI